MCEFSWALGAYIDRICTEINGNTVFTRPHSPQPTSIKGIVKYVNRDDMRPEILSGDVTKEVYTVWAESFPNRFSEVYSGKGSKAQFFQALWNRIDQTWQDIKVNLISKDNSPIFNLDIKDKELKQQI